MRHKNVVVVVVDVVVVDIFSKKGENE